MTPLARLPDPLGSVEIAQAVGPSVLTRDRVCILKRLGRDTGRGRIDGLVESPWAIVGTLVHRSIQLADGRANLTEVFDELVRQEEVSLLADPRRRHLVPLRVAIGEGGWLMRLQLLRRRQGDGNPLPMESLRAQEGTRGTSAQTGHEVWFESAALGLRGSADHVELVGDYLVRITDWKTGPVLTDEGEVRDSYRLQLAAYRMLARERWPEREVETYLFNGESVEVRVTSSDEAEVVEAVTAIRARVGERREAPAIDLIAVGEECFGCNIRNRCPAYLDVLRRTGRGVAAEPSHANGDVLGQVGSFRTRGEVTVVNLKLPTGSQVQMRWTSERLASTDIEGQEVVAFGLLPLSRRSRVDGELLEPLLYEERNQSRRAWQAELFQL